MKWITAVIGLIFLAGLGIETINLKINRQQILFQGMYISAWSKASTAGFYIDSQGQIYTYSFPRNNFERLVRLNLDFGSPPYTTSDILKMSGYTGRLAGTVDPDTVKEMAQHILPASWGEVAVDDPHTPGEPCQSDDAGMLMYIAYDYSRASKRHTPVVLYAAGNDPAVNRSPEARTLYLWLEALCRDHLASSFCPPDPSLCQP